MLLQPIVFPGGATARNRVSLAPLTNLQSHADGTLSEDELTWLARRAEGGFGLVTTCATFVSAGGQGWAGELGIHHDATLPGLTRLAARLRDAGALGVVQLFHGGVRAPSKVTGQQPVSASVFHEEAPTFEVPRAATLEELQRLIGDFAAGAQRAREAGFAGVELHGAHGYLLSQFLSVTMNRREDGWGGPDLVQRARFVREVTRAVRAATPAPFLVGIRLSPEDFGNARGLDLDETVQVARWLVEDGVDFVHLSLWDAAQPTRKRPAEHALPLFRAALPRHVPLIAAGSLWTRDQAQAVLDRGADLVALGRAGILNPDWPRQVEDPGWEPRRPPMSPDELVARAVSPTFVEYLRRWKGFVG